MSLTDEELMKYFGRNIPPELLDFCDYLPGDIAYSKVGIKTKYLNVKYNDRIKILLISLVIEEADNVVYLVKDLDTNCTLIMNQDMLKRTKDEKEI